MARRDKSIDVLRTIALIGIFFAHVQSPGWLLQLRNFDVPMMALLMGTSFYLSNQNKEVKYGDYVKKRIKRLIRPTWTFLTIFFALIFLASIVFGREYPFSIGQIIGSYLLLDGIGYVWIVGVFLGVALLNPFILRASNAIKSNLKYLIILLFLYIGYLGLVNLQQYLDGIMELFYQHLVLYTIAYGIIAAIGIRLKEINQYEMIIITCISFSTFLIMGFNNNFALTQTAKYPPTTYYLSYAVGMIFLLKMMLDIPHIFKLFDNKFVYFISQNSMWIYLWHIIPVYSISLISGQITFIENSYIIQFLLVITFSVAVTYTQNKLISKFRTIKNN